MQPDYWLPRPAPEPDAATQAAFDALLDAAVAAGPNTLLEYTLAAPKWQFLCHVADRRGVALHGSGRADIARFEPRQPQDLNAFGAQNAVYAAADGLWPMYFAIIDRGRYDMTLSNACVRLAEPGQVHGPFYLFSVSAEACRQRPWRPGVVYLLPRATFVEQAPQPFGPYEVRIPQLASLAPVTPLARLVVAPEDFPFLDDIRGHDDARLQEYATAMQTGGPWPEAAGARGVLPDRPGGRARHG